LRTVVRGRYEHAFLLGAWALHFNNFETLNSTETLA
jgi:hypothetical protein